MDHISGTEVLRVSERPPDSQKPLLGRNISNAIFQTVYEHNRPAVRYSDPHLSAQPQLPRYYCNDVHFNNQQSAVENKTGKNFIHYHGYQSLRAPFRECVKVRVDQRCEAFDAPPPLKW